MTNMVTYTHSADGGGSTLVDEFFYNENTEDLYVDLNDKVYLYKYVPKSVFDKFTEAESKGTFYNSNVKGKWGGGEFLGEYPSDVGYEAHAVAPERDHR